jgi:hypothetical protein
LDRLDEFVVSGDVEIVRHRSDSLFFELDTGRFGGHVNEFGVAAAQLVETLTSGEVGDQRRTVSTFDLGDRGGLREPPLLFL